MERNLETQEFHARAQANVSSELKSFDVHSSGTEHHLSICKDTYGVKAFDFFSAQFSIFANYSLSAPTFTTDVIAYTVTEIRTHQQRTLKALLPVGDAISASTHTAQELTQLVLSCKFRCSCNTDISEGVPCRHILTLLYKHSSAFVNCMKYFHPRWIRNKQLPTKRMEDIYVQPSKQSQGASESAFDPFDDRGDPPGMGAAAANGDHHGGDADIGNADDVDDDVATHENLAERIDRFMLSDRPPASDIRSEVHVSHDPKARLNLLNQAFAALVNK